MTEWRRVYVTVEGYTELEFGKAVLEPHLAERCLDVRPRVVTTNRRLGARGGVLSFAQVKSDLSRLMLEDRAAESRERIEGSEAGLKALERQVSVLAPEDIDDGPTTAPSKRIIHHVPSYERAKRRVGAASAAEIGLKKLRAACPHFHEWMTKLEALGVPSEQA